VKKIPRCSRKKYEVATKEPGNPIKQDVKKGKLREFSKGDVYFNYGCIPQTWEDPDVEHHDAKAKGDNDPLDVCEIGLRILKVAEVVPVKVLGTLCLIDEGEADWKVIAIAVSDPWSLLLNDVKDIEEYLPGVVGSIREWFRTYKVTDGKSENEFGLEERCMPAAYAMGVIEETHNAWKNLVLENGEIVPNDIDTSINSKKSDLWYPQLTPAEIIQKTVHNPHSS
jgi:inorganic pyrophosphatase